MTNVEQIFIKKTESESKPDETIEIDVKNGRGSKDKDVPAGIKVNDHPVHGTITAPAEGTWRVVVKNKKGKVLFDESGLKMGDIRCTKYSKGLEKDTIHVDVFWSKSENITFVVDIYYRD